MSKTSVSIPPQFPEDDHSSFYALRRSVRMSLWAYRRIEGGQTEDVIQVDVMGTVAETRALISRCLDIQWRGNNWGVYIGDGYYIEFDLGVTDNNEEDVLERFGIEVVGDGDPSEQLQALAEAGNLVYGDAESGEVVEEFFFLEEQTVPEKNSGETSVPSVPMPEPEVVPEQPSSKVDEDQHTHVRSLEGLEFSDVWFNLRVNEKNIVAMNQNTVLIGTASIEDLYRLIDEFEVNKKVVTKKRLLRSGSQCFRVSSVKEIIENIDSPKCEILFSRCAWPIELTFSSVEEKNDFLDVILTKVSMAKHVVPGKTGISATEIMLLIVALSSAALGMMEESVLLVLAALAVMFYVVFSLVKSGSEKTKSKEIYRFTG